MKKNQVILSIKTPVFIKGELIKCAELKTLSHLATD